MPDPFAMRPQEANALRLMHNLDALSRRVRELENRDRGIQTISLCIATATQVYAGGAGWIDVDWELQRVMDPQYSHTVGTAEVTFNVLSRVFVAYHISMDRVQEPTPTLRVHARLVLDTGGGFNEVIGSHTNEVMVINTDGLINLCISGLAVYVDEGYVLKAQVEVIGIGNIKETINGAGMSAIRLR